MAKKLKTLIFSMIFLAYSAFSSHAMLPEDDPFAGFEAEYGHIVSVPAIVVYDLKEKEQVENFCRGYGFPNDWINIVYNNVKGKAFQIHSEYEVPTLDYRAARLMCNQRRTPENLDLLFNLFGKTPFKNRQKLWEALEACPAYQSVGPFLSQFHYDLDGTVRADFYIVPGTVSLKEKLLNLPQK